MASSNSVANPSPSKGESLLNYLGTIGRRRKIKETKEGWIDLCCCFDCLLKRFYFTVEELKDEAKAAIDGQPHNPATDHQLEEYILGIICVTLTIHNQTWKKVNVIV